MPDVAETQHDVIVFDGLFDERELDDLWAAVELGRKHARPFTLTSNFENGKILEKTLASLIYQKCLPKIPSLYVDSCNREWRPVSACDHIFYAVVEEGSSFGLHTDTGSVYDVAKDEYSKFTVLVYLDESGRDFEGGHTVFVDTSVGRVDVRPVRNRLVMFDIDLYHFGEKVDSGKKRWVGTEFVYKLLK